MVTVGGSGGNFAPQVRQLKCKRCEHRFIQRMNKYGRFDKIKDCRKCGTKDSVETLRIMTYVPE